MTGVEFDQTRAVGAGRLNLPVSLERGIVQGRDDYVAFPKWRGNWLEPSLGAKLREGPVGLRARTVGIQSRRSRIRVRPVGPAAGVLPRPTAALDERLVYLAPLQRRKRGKIDASAGVDVRDREPSERMPYDDRVRLGPDLARIVKRRQSDLLAGQIRSRDLMTERVE